jgi:hypothetical protein
MNIAWLTLIATKLKTVTSKVYFEEAPTGAVMPYIVYSVSGSIDSYDMDAVALEVDVWGKGPDTTALETMAESARKALDNYTATNASVGATVYYTGQLTTTEAIENIRRRRLSFEVNSYYA